MTKHSQPTRPMWISQDSGSIEQFKAQMSQTTDPRDWPLAADVQKNVLIYDGDAIRAAADDPVARRAMMAEWCAAFTHGPGIVVLKNAFDRPDVLDAATGIFERMIDAERSASAGGGDHFAKAGSNDRVWNALEKHCLDEPENFAAYYGNVALAMVAEAWLGVGYQVTAQVNRVNPGGAAQTAHRDYHLGFMSTERMEQYPAHVHALSPALTLQGAVAHIDMPLETGPTLYLPYSQQFFEGYLAFGRPEFQDYFSDSHVQLPLAKGDAVFFNPALMHGAGNNVTADVKRLANLLQVSSAFGRAMEYVDRTAMSKVLYPVLARAEGLSRAQVTAAIAASAEGYPFPTNLDRDPPAGGLAPQTQAALMAEALASGMSAEDFAAAVEAQAGRRVS